MRYIGGRLETKMHVDIQGSPRDNEWGEGASLQGNFLLWLFIVKYNLKVNRCACIEGNERIRKLFTLEVKRCQEMGFNGRKLMYLILFDISREIHG